jgi:hypothetical protein
MTEEIVHPQGLVVIISLNTSVEWIDGSRCNGRVSGECGRAR